MRRLVRVQGQAGQVAEMTAAALGAVGVPSLAAILAAADRRAFLDIELKTVPPPSIIEILAAGRGPELSGAVISSFDNAALVRIERLAPSWPRWLNSHTLEPYVVDRAVELGCVGICADWESVDQDAMERATAAGLTHRRVYRPRSRDVRPARQPGRGRRLRGSRGARRLRAARPRAGAGGRDAPGPARVRGLSCDH